MTHIQKSLVALMPFVYVLFAASTAFADGKFFNNREIVNEPGIQNQRAVVAFRDGVETLIVQSDIDAQSDAFGWLLPLPAEPTGIEACPPQCLKILSTLIAPKFANPHDNLYILGLGLAIILLVASWDHLRQKRRGNNKTSIGKVIATIVVLFFLLSLLLPSLSGPRGIGVNAASDVTILQTTKAGVYDISVIKAKNIDAIKKWLDENGFRSPPTADAVIKDHIKDGWRFIAAKISADNKGEVTHHPLKITFPTKKAIYPLRLTGSDGQPIVLDLYVIADGSAVAPNMETWYSDFCKEVKDHRDYLGDFQCTTPPVFRPKNQPFSLIGMPSISTSMWPDCTFTWLRGRLDAKAMSNDLRINIGDTSPMKLTIHSQLTALKLSGAVMTFVFALLLGCFALRAGMKKWKYAEFLRRRASIALLIAVTCGGLRYFTLRVVESKETDQHPYSFLSASRDHSRVLDELNEKPPQRPFPEAYRAQLAKHHDNGEPVLEKQTPEMRGEYRIDKTETGWMLVFVDWHYVPFTVPISGEGQPIRIQDNEKDPSAPQ